jgi:DedD protein
MGLLSFLKRKKTDAAPARGGSRAPESADSLQQVKTRARRRLIGAAVLVIVAVIGFPMIFETQPRPLATDVPIEIARKDAAATQPARSTGATKPVAIPPGVVVEPPPDAEKEPVKVAAAPVVAPAPAPEPAPAPKPVEPEVKKPEPKKVEEKKPEPKKAEEKKAEEKKPAAKPAEPAKAASTATAHRYVVQVGAFTDSTAVKDARQKVEKVGLTTYTQPVESATGKRIRVRIGPFTSREEAEKAAAKIKPTGLQTAIFTL